MVLKENRGTMSGTFNFHNKPRDNWNAAPETETVSYSSANEHSQYSGEVAQADVSREVRAIFVALNDRCRLLELEDLNAGSIVEALIDFEATESPAISEPDVIRHMIDSVAEKPLFAVRTIDSYRNLAEAFDSSAPLSEIRECFNVLSEILTELRAAHFTCFTPQNLRFPSGSTEVLKHLREIHRLIASLGNQSEGAIFRVSELLCNGHSLPVTTEAVSALADLFQRDKSNATKWAEYVSLPAVRDWEERWPSMALFGTRCLQISPFFAGVGVGVLACQKEPTEYSIALGLAVVLSMATWATTRLIVRAALRPLTGAGINEIFNNTMKLVERFGWHPFKECAQVLSARSEMGYLLNHTKIAIDDAEYLVRSGYLAEHLLPGRPFDKFTFRAAQGMRASDPELKESDYDNHDLL